MRSLQMGLGFGFAAMSVFAMPSARAGAETVLHHFGNGIDGANPRGGMIFGPDGNLYGVATGGGIQGPVDCFYPGTSYCGGGYGVVFKLTTRGRFSVFYAFEGGVPLPAGGYATDGAVPLALVMGPDGNFYGTTQFGGANASARSVFNRGTFFRITPDGQETVLHRFGTGGDHQPSSASPDAPTSLTYDDDGDFYGVSWQYEGDYFESPTEFVKISADGTANSVSYAPVTYSPLVASPDGNLVGESGDFVFQLTPSGSMSFLHKFPYSKTTTFAQTPVAVILGNDGNYYGVTQYGGGTNYGTVFKLSPDGQLTTLHVFTSGDPNGEQPTSLVESANGGFFGTTCRGGANGYGTVFKMSAKGTVHVLYSFAGGTADGSCPDSPLLIGKGVVYGATSQGGANNAGTLYSISIGGS